MPHSFGKRARTRDLFARPFRKHGPVHLSQYLQTFKVGEYVDVKANGSIQAGMPFKFYHGKTGKIWNVTPRAVGVVVNKQVRNRIIPKKIHVRVEHVQKSDCQMDVKARMQQVLDIRKWNKENPEKKKSYPKRLPAQPDTGFTLTMKHKKLVTVDPVPYEILA
jgi:large subunit ribosomal protein L21e